MRVSRSEMERSHKRIVDGAARLVRERGIDNTSVADVMAEAGLKHGGFYRHFDSKDALIDAAIQSAFQEVIAVLESQLKKDAEKVVTKYRNHYLSRGHVRNPGVGCPVAGLGGDVARGTEELKASFGAGVKEVIARIAQGMPESKQAKQRMAAREFAMMVGAVIIARASDDETADQVLSACRENAKDR